MNYRWKTAKDPAWAHRNRIHACFCPHVPGIRDQALICDFGRSWGIGGGGRQDDKRVTDGTNRKAIDGLEESKRQSDNGDTGLHEHRLTID